MRFRSLEHDAACLTFGFDDDEPNDAELDYDESSAGMGSIDGYFSAATTDSEDEDEDDTDDDREEPAPSVIDFRPSPECSYSPRARMIVERLREHASTMLNVYRGAISDAFWLDRPIIPGLGFDRQTPPIQRIAYLNVLSAEDHAYLLGEIAHYEAHLFPLLESATGEEGRDFFVEMGHHARDYQLLLATAALLGEPLRTGHSWEIPFRRWDASPARRAYYRARDVMRKADPLEREAARTRDAKRRKSKSRQEYQAAYQATYQAAYRTTPEAKSRDAARKRAARAAKKAASAAA
ncbi:MAG: hypothetical protein BGO98_29640 [Myxococcales bacterium 68-20]|nr:MAG: hypothetical protein BGO98_29640 [Myxococcales bacterium 68-20]